MWSQRLTYIVFCFLFFVFLWVTKQLTLKYCNVCFSLFSLDYQTMHIQAWIRDSTTEQDKFKRAMVSPLTWGHDCDSGHRPKDSKGRTWEFPRWHCLGTTVCSFVTCPLCYCLNCNIRFWQLSADADKHLGFSLLLPIATMEFIPGTICPAVLLAQDFGSNKTGRESYRQKY